MEDMTWGRRLHVAGMFLTVFCALATMLIVFVLPAACSFVFGMQLVLLAFLFMTGIVMILVGFLLAKRESNMETNSPVKE